MQLTRGYIGCEIATTGPDNYQDHQLQQWGWTNSPPIQITASNQIFSATWSVTGGGSKFVLQSGGGHTQSNSVNWTESGSLTVQMQVRMSGSQVVLTGAGPVVLAGGLNGTQQATVDGMLQTPISFSGAVNGQSLPAVQWNGPQYARRLPDGSEQPAPAASSLSKPGSPGRTGSLLGLVAVPLGNSYTGSLQQPNPQLSGYQAPFGTTSTATWRWRIYF